MDSILEELYYGELRPAERRRTSSALYDRCGEACDRLCGSLDEGQKKLFLRFEECINARSSREDCQAFALGFSLAVRLLAESFRGP